MSVTPLFGIMIFCLRMILSENRIPLFGIMHYSGGVPLAANTSPAR